MALSDGDGPALLRRHAPQERIALAERCLRPHGPEALRVKAHDGDVLARLGQITDRRVRACQRVIDARVA